MRESISYVTDCFLHVFEKTLNPYMDNKTLIKRCIKQDRKAQKLLFDQYKGMIMGVCLRYAKHRMEAEDIFQEVWIKVFGSLDTLRESSALGGWIKSIAVRTAINFYKQQLKYTYKEIDSHDQGEWIHTQDQEIVQNIDREILLNFLQELPDSQRLVFNLAALEGYPHKEIALQLDITEASSRVYLAKARKLLQQKIQLLFHRSKENYET